MLLFTQFTCLHARYGEVADLCTVGSTDVYCNGYGADSRGVNMTRLTSEGTRYLRKSFPKLTVIKSIKVI